jgi:hypothetical protein
MTYEATAVEGPYEVHDFTVYPNQPTIEKGTLLKFSGDRAVAPTSADNDVFAGIAASEHVTGQGNTNISVYTKGIFKCYFDALVTAVTPGLDVSISGANICKIYTTLDDEKGLVVGKCLQTVSPVGYYEVKIG